MAYLERYYWFWKAKSNLLRLTLDVFGKRNKLLDAGCGAGNLLRVGKLLGYECTGIDKSKSVKKIIKDIPVIIKDVEKLKIRNKFDTIILSDVLEHCNDKKAMANIYNALTDNGIVIATVPMFKFLWGQDDIRLQHKRRYTKKMIKELFKDFKIVKMSYIQFLLFFPAFIIRTLERIKKPKTSTESFFKNRLLIEDQHTDMGQITMLLSLPIKAIFFFINFLIKVEQYIENRIVIPLGLPIGVGMLIVARKVQRKPSVSKQGVKRGLKDE